MPRSPPSLFFPRLASCSPLSLSYMVLCWSCSTKFTPFKYQRVQYSRCILIMLRVTRKNHLPLSASKALASVATRLHWHLTVSSLTVCWAITPQWSKTLHSLLLNFVRILCPVLQPIEVPLKGSTSAGSASYSSQFILHPIIQVINDADWN